MRHLRHQTAEARILHVEDSEAIRQVVANLLAVRGVHRVVAWAESVAQAGERLEEIKNQSLDANVVLLDGNLNGNGDEIQNHPKAVVDKIKELQLELPVIGLSGNGLALHGLIVGEDIKADLIKSEWGESANELEHILDEVAEQTK